MPIAAWSVEVSDVTPGKVVQSVQSSFTTYGLQSREADADDDA